MNHIAELLPGDRIVCGEIVVVAKSPEHAMARKLLKLGLAAPDDLLSVWCDGIRCSTQTVGRLAALTVQENDRGLRLVKYQPPPAFRKPGEAVTGADD